MGSIASTASLRPPWSGVLKGSASWRDATLSAGIGLLLLDALGTSWGVTPAGSVKVVWSEVQT